MTCNNYLPVVVSTGFVAKALSEVDGVLKKKSINYYTFTHKDNEYTIVLSAWLRHIYFSFFTYMYMESIGHQASTDKVICT